MSETIKIRDINEPLVPILEYCPNIVIAMEPWRLRKERTAYLRLSVAKRLARARSYLPKNTTFVVNDAWRSPAIQTRYFQQYKNRFRKLHPNWSDEKIHNLAGNYAIPPEKLNEAGHISGAAVDLELWKNGRRLPMKSKKIEFIKTARLDTRNMPAYILRNRELLADVMQKAGFINYPPEYWHWSYGDWYWARASNGVTKYGSVDIKVFKNNQKPKLVAERTPFLY